MGYILGNTGQSRNAGGYVYKIAKSGWIGEMITECGIHAA